MFLKLLWKSSFSLHSSKPKQLIEKVLSKPHPHGNINWLCQCLLTSWSGHDRLIVILLRLNHDAHSDKHHNNSYWMREWYLIWSCDPVSTNHNTSLSEAWIEMCPRQKKSLQQSCSSLPKAQQLHSWWNTPLSIPYQTREWMTNKTILDIALIFCLCFTKSHWNNVFPYCTRIISCAKIENHQNTKSNKGITSDMLNASICYLLITNAAHWQPLWLVYFSPDYHWNKDVYPFAKLKPQRMCCWIMILLSMPYPIKEHYLTWSLSPLVIQW